MDFNTEKIAAIYAKVRAYWDTQADQFNQWTELSDDEKAAVILYRRPAGHARDGGE